MIRIGDKNFKEFITERQIEEKVTEIAQSLDMGYQDKNPLLVCVLSGAFVFAADLIREMKIRAEITFIKVRSYQGTESAGEVSQVMGLDKEVAGRDVVIIEDIVDTGITAHYILEQIEAKSPHSVAFVSLFLKPDAIQQPIQLRNVGFKISDKFIVGYGMDYDERGRNLKSIYQLAE